jgi:hypothetical protein
VCFCWAPSLRSRRSQILKVTARSLLNFPHSIGIVPVPDWLVHSQMRNATQGHRLTPNLAQIATDLLLPGLAMHADLLGRMPHLVTAHAAFFSQRNEAGPQSRGGG